MKLRARSDRWREGLVLSQAMSTIELKQPARQCFMEWRDQKKGWVASNQSDGEEKVLLAVGVRGVCLAGPVRVLGGAARVPQRLAVRGLPAVVLADVPRPPRPAGNTLVPRGACT